MLCQIEIYLAETEVHFFIHMFVSVGMVFHIGVFGRIYSSSNGFEKAVDIQV